MNESSDKNKTRQILASLSQIYQLKQIPRSGWLQNGIATEAVESIASHSYGMAILILYLERELLERGVDVERALKMALVHDMAETIVGDLTPDDHVPETEKYEAEARAFDQIVGDLSQGEHFKELWQDFERCETMEAKVVKRIDKLDMLIQAYLYEREFELRLDSFWVGMDDLFLGSECEPIYQDICANRFELKGNER